MLEPILCGHITVAPLLPKLRGHFAEFLDNASPAGLGILSPSTCVGLRYGCITGHSGFSWHGVPMLRYLLSLRLTPPDPVYGFSFTPPSALAPGFPLPAHAFPMRPRSSAIMQYRNIHLLSIGYAPRPRLRPRLSQGRSALPWNPWISGQEDSHLFLATHSGILSSHTSTAPSGTASPVCQCSPTTVYHIQSQASAACFSPGHFRRGTSRLVSCYALFECVAASEPTS